MVDYLRFFPLQNRWPWFWISGTDHLQWEQNMKLEFPEIGEKMKIALTRYSPHPLKRPLEPDLIAAIGNAIGCITLVYSIRSAVRNIDTSFAIMRVSKFGWLMISSNECLMPSTPSRLIVPKTTTTFCGSERLDCVQWAAVKMNRGPMIEPPQKWSCPLLRRSDAWYGNCPSSADRPPITRPSEVAAELSGKNNCDSSVPFAPIANAVTRKQNTFDILYDNSEYVVEIFIWKIKTIISLLQHLQERQQMNEN